MAVAEMNTATYNNVGFKYGPQSGLRTVMTEKKVVPGTFYLTSDTNRLYIGKTTELIAPVNEGVIKVAKIEDLPKDADSKDTGIIGSFYYVEDGNILCVFNGSKWVQINPDTTVTNEDLSITLGAVTKDKKDDAEDEAAKVSITTTVTDSNTNSQFGSFVLVTDSVDKKKTIELEIGTRDESPAVILTGDTYTLSASKPENTTNKVNIDLGSAFGHESSINLSSTGSVHINSTGSNIELEGFKAVEGTLVNDTIDNTEGFEISLVDHNGDKATVTINPIIVVGQGDNAKESIGFEGSEAALPVYTAAEIDSKIETLGTNFDNLIKGYNALEYKGTVGSNADASYSKLPDGASEGQKVSIGYAYLASSDFYMDEEQKVKITKGSLIIATAGEDVTEGADGYLPSDGIVWTTVSGDTADTHYAFVGDANTMGVELRDTTNDQSAGKLLFTVTDTAEKSGLQISRNTSSTAAETTLEIGHKEIKEVDVTSETSDSDKMEALDPGFEFTYISDLVSDGYGHITGYKTKTATILDTTYDFTVDEASITVKEVTGGGVEITPVFSMSNTVTDDDYTPTKAEGIALNSSTLDIGVNADKKTIEVNLLWEAF